MFWLTAFTLLQSNPAPKKCALLICLCMVISACKTVSPVETPTLPDVPADWSTKRDQPSPISNAWIQTFEDAKLTALVAEADQNNYTLLAAEARWQAARAQTAITDSARLPSVSAEADASRNRSNAQTFDTLRASLRMNWELDVWSRLADDTRASLRDEQALAADYTAARLSLAANVARTWFALLEANAQITLAKQTVQTFAQSLEVIEERYRRGLNSALDVRLARSDHASAQNAVALRERERDAFTRQIEALAGRYPAASLVADPRLPEKLPAVPVGLPSDLLIRRPDLLAAEARLNAAGDRLLAARKNRLPQIRLSGNTGVSSDSLAQLLDWDALVVTLLAGIVQPIYQGGRLDAERMLASARHNEAWANYAQTLLIAFREVETALAAEQRYTEQLRALLLASKEADEAAELAMTRYQNGLADIITLLQSQRQAFTSRSQYLSVLQARLANRIDLHLALGGDFLPSAAIKHHE